MTFWTECRSEKKMAHSGNLGCRCGHFEMPVNTRRNSCIWARSVKVRVIVHRVFFSSHESSQRPLTPAPAPSRRPSARPQRTPRRSRSRWSRPPPMLGSGATPLQTHHLLKPYLQIQPHPSHRLPGSYAVTPSGPKGSHWRHRHV